MKKTKFTSAAAKHQYLELEKSWNLIKTKHTETVKPAVKAKFKISSVAPQMSTSRQTTDNIPSLVTAGGSCGKKETLFYTGDKIIGIATIHKSCLQPIFNKQSAVDVAHMRR